MRYELRHGERWYVAMTLPHKEHVAAANLNNQKFRCFLPLQNENVRRGRKLRSQLAPMFPRYIFIILNSQAQRWRSVNGTIGISRLLTDGQAPLPVQGGIVDTLILSSDQRGAVVFRRCLAPGDRVRMLAGPFAEHLGTLERLNGAGRVQVLLETLVGELQISVPRDLVVAR